MGKQNKLRQLFKVFVLSTCMLLLTYGPAFAQSPWPQVGADIDGAMLSALGTSVSFNSDGSIVAIGAYLSGAGQVHVYENQAGSWVQSTAVINGEAAGDWFGESVSLNADGTIVAIGARFNDGAASNAGHVRVYENQGGTWVQLGADIDGEAAEDNSGLSVSLNDSGSIVAIGASFNDGVNGADSGHVRVYENQLGTWVQIGADIDGEAASDQSGHSVSLNATGSIIAVGALENDGGGTGAGHVRVYENQAGSWVQIGADIDGEAALDYSGQSVSLNSSGSILAVGAYGNDAGHVQVYENQAGTWTQIGANIAGEAVDDQFGYAVSLSADGSRVAVGAVANDGGGANAGHVQIYQNVSGTWFQVGGDIDGEAADDRSGTSVSLSADGSLVAIGAPFNDGNGTLSGQVRVFEAPALAPDLAIHKRVDPSAAAPGEAITYTLAFSNTGLGLASDVVITDMIPVSVTNTSVISSGNAFSPMLPITQQLGTHYVWDVADLATGEGGTITITGVLSDVLMTGLFTNTAVITTTASESDPIDNLSSVSVTVQNLAPLAVDDNYATDEDVQLVVAAPGVLSNDSDANGDALTAVLDDDSLISGTLELSSDGGLIYTPTLNASGVFSFSYHASDGDLDSELATVTLTVSALNDPPVALDDSLTVDEDSQNNAVDVLANDSFAPDLGETLSVFAVGDPANGTAVDNDTEVLYTPDADFAGVEVFTYTVSDGNGGVADASVTVTVTNINDAPTALDDIVVVPVDSQDNALDVLANDTFAPDTGETLSVFAVGDPADGTAVDNDTEILYTPDTSFSGVDVFTYTISDGNGGFDTASISVTVSNVNSPPTAVDDSFAVDEDSQDNALDVLANDSFAPDLGETLSVFAVGDAANGTAVDNDTEVLYTPHADFAGMDVFTYTISDGNGGFDTASITVTVSNVNDAPLFSSTPVTTATAAVSYTYAIATTDVDISDTRAISATLLPAWLTFGDNGDGTALLSGMPVLADEGDHPVTLVVTDTAGLSATQVFTISVSADLKFTYLPVVTK